MHGICLKIMVRNPNRFPTTSWTLVLDAARDEARRSALEQLCEVYWPPVFAYVRWQVGDTEEAKDLTQAFFTALLEKHYLRSAARERGRFRAFLLATLKHFLANERDRARTQRRGRGQPPVSLDFSQFDGLAVPAENMSPDRVFEKRWALLMLGRALQTLRGQYEATGRVRQFESLKGLLTGSEQGSHYKALAAELGTSQAAVKMAMHRLRLRFGEALRAEISQTVTDVVEVDDELRYLLSVLRA